MKTTIELPDVMFRQAKALAAARGVTLKRFFTEALEAQLLHCKGDGRTGHTKNRLGWPASARCLIFRTNTGAFST